MGSPLAPNLANIFMRYFEENALQNYSGISPILYRRYVDDIFLIFKSQSEVQPFYDHLNSFHPNIQFTKEEETPGNDFFPFLDVKVSKHGNSFSTSTFYKPTHTGVYTNWYSFTPRKFKLNLVKCLLSRAWKICSNKNLFQQDWQVIKLNLIKNQYPEKLLDSIANNFIKKAESTPPQEDVQLTVSKKEVSLIMPFYGNQSTILHKRLKSLFAAAYPQVNLNVVFRSTFRVVNLFHLKDPIPLRLKSNIVYGVHCTNCSSFYVGKTKRHLMTRFSEHRDVRKPSAVTEHLMSTGHDVTIDNVKVYGHGKFDRELLIKESLIIKSLKPDLNETISSFPLELF